MTKTRVKVLMHYLKRKGNTSLNEIVNFFFAPSYETIAKKFIQRIDQHDKYDKVYFEGISEPMFYPKGIKRHSLFLVTVECFNKKNWHYYEIPQTSVSPGDAVIDCGAAEGLFSFKIYRKCKQVYLIEPLSKFVGTLNKTFEKAGNVEILPIAISDKEYSTKISDNDTSSALSDTEEGEIVSVTTLDKIFFERNTPIHYLKMDLEGHDYKALLGAEHLIKKYMPKIAVTTYHDINHASQIANFLKSIVPEYNILCKGIYQETGSPVMLHAWIDKKA